MGSRVARPSFEDPALHREIMRLRQVDNHTNLHFLALEYACLALVIGSAVVFAEYRQSWGFSWSWNVPVFAIAVMLIGGIQHRLAGLGHESSHYSFMKSRTLNDLIPDLFCMFPLMTTIHFYRLFHMGHHQFTNDPARDPDLQNLGHGKRADEFPMPRQRFITVIYLCFLVAPMRFLQYQWAYFKVNTLGKGKSVYIDRAADAANTSDSMPRLATVLGVAYIIGLGLVLKVLTGTGRPLGLAPAGLAGIALLAVIIRVTARLGRISVAVPPSLLNTACGISANDLLHDRARCPGLSPVVHRRQVGDLSRNALAGSAGQYVHVLHVLARCLSALQCRLREVDQFAGLLHRPLHAVGCSRLWPGHAHSASSLSGSSPLPATAPA